MIKPRPPAEKEPKVPLPTGGGGEFAARRRERAIPVEEVKNTVLWVNPAFEGVLPFEITEGQTAKLAAFFSKRTKGGKEEEETEGRRAFPIIPEIYRGRSGLLGEVIFQDKEGRLYRDVDEKGIGHFINLRAETLPATYVARRLEEVSEEKVWGLLDAQLASWDTDMSELMLSHGIRTCRTVAIIKLEEIIDQKEGKISVEEAKKKGLIPEGFDPVIQIRAYQGTRERVVSLHPRPGLEENIKNTFEDARALVAYELGKEPEDLSADEYIAWFAQTLGEQVAKLHKAGLHHGYLTAHNITLDCYLPDTDSVNKVANTIAWYKREEGRVVTEKDIYKSDLTDAYKTLSRLVECIGLMMLEDEDIEKAEHYQSIFKAAYEQELKPQQD